MLRIIFLGTLSLGTLWSQAQLGPAQRFAQQWWGGALAVSGDIDNDGSDEVFRGVGGTVVTMMKQNDAGHYMPFTLVAAAPSSIGQIVIADIDGDGLRDLVLCAGDLLWAKNLGGASFGPTQTLASTGWVISGSLLADLDGDLDLDAVLRRNSPSGLYWTENTGGGSFGPAISIYTGTSVSPWASDLDGDLDADIVFLLNGAPDLLWLENDGSAAFTQHVIPTGTTSYYELCVADMDGDLDNDLLVADESLGVNLIVNLSPGTFAAPAPTAITGGGIPSLHGLCTADRNGDGDQDVCYTLNGDLCDPAYLLCWGNDGSGTLGSGGGGGFSADDGLAADGLVFCTGQFDGDAGIDLLWGDSDALRVDGTQITDPGCRSVIAIDGDLDGDQDVVIGSNVETALCADPKKALAFHENAGVIGIDPLPHAQFASFEIWLKRLAKADLDGDLDEDLIATHGSIEDWTRYFWFRNMGGGQFDSTYLFGTYYDAALTAPLVGDVDIDVDVDVVTPGDLSSNLVLHRNDGSGTFDPGIQVVSTTSDVGTMGLGDLDDDGDLDYVWAYSGLYWSANDGAGTGGTAVLIASGVNCYASLDVPENISTFDLDLDGDSDLVVPLFSSGSHSVAVLLNNGGGSFSAPSLFPLTGLVRFKVADMSGDGYPDLLAPAGGAFHLLLNQGDGSFTGWQVLTTPDPVPGVSDMDIADLDGDGWQDVIITAGGSSAMWYRNELLGIPLSVSEVPDRTVLVSPNPAHSAFTVTCREPFDAIEIQDVHGRVLRSFSGDGTLEMSLVREGLAPGMYMVRVHEAGRQLGAVRLVLE